MIRIRRESSVLAAPSLLAVLLVGVAAVLLLAEPAWAGTTFEVNTTTDPETPTTTGCDQTECTLREAVAAANDETANPGKDVISFSPALGGETISLSRADGDVSGPYALEARSEISINAPETGGITVARSSSVSSLRLFYVSSGGSLTMDGITVKDGRTGSAGAGIFMFEGTLKMTNGALLNNTAASTQGGGGIYNVYGTVTVEDSVSSGNSSRFGGDIYVFQGTVTVERSTFTGNKVSSALQNYGGSIYNDQGSVTVRDSTISGGDVVFGGGIYNRGSLTVERSTISGNEASEGGGLYNFGGSTTIKDSTISGNAASAGGGILNKASLTVRGSTITENSYNAGSGIYNFSGTTNVGSTIIAMNDTGLNDVEPDVRGAFASQGYNLIGDAGGSTGFAATGDQTGSGASVIDPKLGPLQDNGGPTETHALLFGSPAIDGSKVLGLTTDQRGSPRPTDLPGVQNASGGDGSDTGAVEFKPTNAVADSYDTDEDTPLNVSAPGVLANDVGGDGGALSASMVSGPDHGELSLQAGGSFIYTPDADYVGADSFTYKASAGTFESEAAQVVITVRPVNDAPAATNNSYSVSEDQTLTVSDGPTDVLANDTDPEGNSLTATLVSGPASGTLNLNPNGSFTYTPNANFSGTDSFTYKASDDTSESNTATVNLTVKPLNDAPSFTKGQNQSVQDKAGAQSVANWATNISVGPPNESAQSLQFIVTSDNNSLFTATGRPAVSSNGTLTYTPAVNANGTANVQVVARDSGGTSNGGDNTSDAQSFTIAVNDATAPKVNRVVAAENAAGIAPAANVHAVFSEPMRATSVNANFKLYKVGTTTAIGASVTYDAATKRAVLNPSANLQRGATYRAVASAAARDLAGNALDQDPSVTGNQQKVWFFTLSP